MMIRRFFSFKLPKLPFGTRELSPIYDDNTISYHWGKHHQTYVDNLNNALLHPSPSHVGEGIIGKLNEALGKASPSMLKEKLQKPMEQAASAPGTQPHPPPDEKSSSKADDAMKKAQEKMQETVSNPEGFKDKVLHKIDETMGDYSPNFIKEQVKHSQQEAQKSESDLPLLEIIQNRAQQSVSLRNNGGGHYNHCLFWLCLGTAKEAPTGRLLTDINKEFGSIENLIKEFSTHATEVFGSGWTWLCLNHQGRLEIVDSPNQDNPLMKGIIKNPSIPFFTLDLWEHAYYLQYQNRRLEYVQKMWSVVNWKRIEEMYEQYAVNEKPVPVDQLLEA